MTYEGIDSKAMLLAAFCLLGSLSAMAQQKSISGTVTGEDGSPVPGVTVMIKGTSIGTSTGADGKYCTPSTTRILILSLRSHA